jgi:pimeloyl-ACP methyl ester carboxylesterase
LHPTISQQASECEALLSYLQVSSAHIVGHSHGAVIGLQLALDYPSLVRSLSLLEPGLAAYLPEERRKALQEKILPAVQGYERGQRKEAIDQMLQIVGGREYKNTIESILPGFFEHAVEDADSFFKLDLPANRSWSFSEEDISRIDVPILCVLGSGTQPIFRAAFELVQLWFPKSETLVVENATHWLHITNARDLAEVLAIFLRKLKV